MLRRDRLRWALAAAASACAFAVTGLLSIRTGWGVALDGAVDSWVLNELPEGLRLLLSDAARPLVIVVLTPVVIALALLALARGAWRRAVAATFIPSAATVAALGLPLQNVLGTGTDAFPSHHAAAGIGLLVGLGVVWPRPVSRRWLVGLGVLGFLVALGNVSWHAHQPRDVVGSALLVAVVAAATFALLGGDSPNLAPSVDEPSRRTPEPAPST
ncbi:hypothetical protein [Terrabacter sp. 2RAF25]|uniref:hypothetical protein n=1 Tax=Terrabacter sp. 2RAF25 TaxID=3232998 RepID=UPI003F965AA2